MEKPKYTCKVLEGGSRKYNGWSKEGLLRFGNLTIYNLDITYIFGEWVKTTLYQSVHYIEVPYFTIEKWKEMYGYGTE